MTGRGGVRGGPSTKTWQLPVKRRGIPFGLGSMRIVNRYPHAAHTFDVKSLCPDVPMFANIGLVQLNYGFGANEINRLVDSVRADGLCVHLNHIQEACQPEGDTDWSNLYEKFERVLPEIKVPGHCEGRGPRH